MWESLHSFPLVLKSERNKYINCSFKKIDTERKATIGLCLLKLTPLMHRLLETFWQVDPRDVDQTSWVSHILPLTPEKTHLRVRPKVRERKRVPCLCCARTANTLCMYTMVSTRKGSDPSGQQVPTTISMSTFPE